MRIESSGEVDRKQEDVYVLVRDHLADLIPYLPNIEEVRVVERRDGDGVVHIVNEWRARATVPKMAARFVPPEMFQWKDTATWKDAEHLVEYHLEGYGWEADGVNRFEAVGEATRIHIGADITVHPEVFHIPRMLFNKVFPLVEDTVRKALAPNMTALVDAVRNYYRAH